MKYRNILILLILLCVLHKKTDATGYVNQHQIQYDNKNSFTPPILSFKSIESIGDIDFTSYNISYLNTDVEKVLNEISNLHKPGASIAFEISTFEINKDALLIRIGVKTGKITKEKLMYYLQGILNDRLKS